MEFFVTFPPDYLVEMYKTRAERLLALALERKETKAWGNYKAVNPESSKPVQSSCSSNDNNNDTVFF